MKIIIRDLLILILSIPCISYASTLDRFLGEEYEDGSFAKENEYIDKLAEISIQSLKTRYPENTGAKIHVPRDVHGKSHGCLFGNIETKNDQLPANLRVGIFEHNREHKVVLRYSSNDKSKSFKDIREDIRGMGLKVMNVNGETGRSQDFLFLGSETFFIKDNAFYVDFLKVLMKSTKTWSGLWLALKDPKGAFSVGSDMLRTSYFYHNPLEIPFFTAVPYRLGAKADKSGSPNTNRRAVKYRITHGTCDDESSFRYFQKFVRQGYEQFTPTKVFRPNFLRENLKYAMDRADACLNLSVQIRDQKDMAIFPVEDSSIKWNAEYIDVAKIRLHTQSFDEPKMNEFCENITFTPWNTLPEHRPLGRINRARKTIYERVSSYRHIRNEVKDYKEPTDFSMQLSY